MYGHTGFLMAVLFLLQAINCVWSLTGSERKILVEIAAGRGTGMPDQQRSDAAVKRMLRERDCTVLESVAYLSWALFALADAAVHPANRMESEFIIAGWFASSVIVTAVSVYSRLWLNRGKANAKEAAANAA